jgi:3' terminal RNA ribose 2'-O-methyltransferase Hen1
MLLSITTTHRPATDLGFLLHKHPDNVRTVQFPFGDAHVFFPEATEERCTATLLLEVDPVGLVRRKGRKDDTFALAGYVNDRPYVASSFTSVVLAKVFGTAMGGRCENRPELADSNIPLEVELPVVPCRGGEEILRRCFEPLGYDVEAAPLDLDDRFPDWGESRYLQVRLSTVARLAAVLSHLYVLLPVLDSDKHYWVGEDEVDKLIAKGEPWLGRHPDRELIIQRYLRHRRALTVSALARLSDDESDSDELDQTRDLEEQVVEEQISLNTQRIGAVLAALQAAAARRVVDLGCGEGRLLDALRRDPSFVEIVGVDASHRALEKAAGRLKLERAPDRQRERIRLIHSGLTYRDRRLEGFDAATVVEVIEHLDPPRLGAFEQAVFAFARPGTVVVTTPNREYNANFETMPAGELRHRDHRFEWTRAEFGAWANGVADRHGYAVRFLPIGDEDVELGPPTQMAVFSR